MSHPLEAMIQLRLEECGGNAAFLQACRVDLASCEPCAIPSERDACCRTANIGDARTRERATQNETFAVALHSMTAPNLLPASEYAGAIRFGRTEYVNQRKLVRSCSRRADRCPIGRKTDYDRVFLGNVAGLMTALGDEAPTTVSVTLAAIAATGLAPTPRAEALTLHRTL
jgi:hypothetical protein